MSFDLTREAWIPVLLRQPPNSDLELGITSPALMSLRDVLKEAHTIEEVHAESPLQTGALYRLLQALTLRIFLEPMGTDVDAWLSLYDEGHFSASAIDAYFDEWQDQKERFDLLHPERPFYQHQDPPDPNVGSLGWIYPSWAKGNNATLFDHTTDDDERSVSLDSAARQLVAIQSYGLQGLAGGGRPNYSDAPLVSGAMFWIRGSSIKEQSLFNALLLNSPPNENARMAPGGTPCWEIESFPEPSTRTERGYLDYLTWPSRRILLLTDFDVSGKEVALSVKISRGDKRDPGGEDDPLMALKYSDTAGNYPLKLDRERALWRDANVFMRVLGDKGGVPPTLQWVASGLEEPLWWVDVFGLVNDRAKIERWEQARMPVYAALIQSPTKQEILDKAISRAERQATDTRARAGSLRRACRECAAALLSSTDSYDDLSKQGRKDARALAEAMDAESRYWARLEEPFFAWLRQIATSSDHDRLLADWTQTVWHEALRSYEDATLSIGESARHVRAQAAGRILLSPTAAFKKHLDAEAA